MAAELRRWRSIARMHDYRGAVRDLADATKRWIATANNAETKRTIRVIFIIPALLLFAGDANLDCRRGTALVGQFAWRRDRRHNE